MIVTALCSFHPLEEKLEKELYKLLPAFHAFTGCDIASGLCQTGKGKAWKARLNKTEENKYLVVVRPAEAFISLHYTPA